MPATHKSPNRDFLNQRTFWVLWIVGFSAWVVLLFLASPHDLQFSIASVDRHAVFGKWVSKFGEWPAWMLVIASLVQMVEIILKKISPPLYQALGIFLPLITTNCAVLGVALLAQSKNFDLLQSLVFAIANAVGFALAMILFAGLREHMNLMQVPKGMRGVPIALVAAGILAMAFMGFAGMVK